MLWDEVSDQFASMLFKLLYVVVGYDLVSNNDQWNLFCGLRKPRLLSFYSTKVFYSLWINPRTVVTPCMLSSATLSFVRYHQTKALMGNSLDYDS